MRLRLYSCFSCASQYFFCLCKNAPTQRQVNALSKERNVKLVFDPDVRLDSDEPGYKNGHFRIDSAEVFQLAGEMGIDKKLFLYSFFFSH